MAFRVEVAPRALKDLDDIVAFIEERGSVDQAEKWFDGIMRAIERLGSMPNRCPLAGESRALGIDVRVLLYGKRNRKYKVYFAVNSNAKSVGILHVRHWAQRRLRSGELQDLMEDLLDSGNS